MRAYAATHAGLVREQNEDTISIDPREGLYILADGMGGHQAGEVASAMAASMMRELLQGEKPSLRRLEQAYSRVNAAIFTRQQEEKELNGMGTTLTVIWEKEDHLLLGHVGDSRAYLFRQGVLKQVSEDHSVVGELLLSGAITAEEARMHPFRHVITRAIGTDPIVRVDTAELQCASGDQWLLCSDGLTDMATDEDIADVLRFCPAEDRAQALIDLALQGGGGDNVSVIVLEAEK